MIQFIQDNLSIALISFGLGFCGMTLFDWLNTRYKKHKITGKVAEK